MLPQLDYTTYPSQIFWLLINILLLYFCISSVVIPRIDKIVHKRQSILAENKQETEKNNQTASGEEERYNVALKKARLLAQDIIKDNQMLLEQNRMEAYKILKEEVEELQKAKEQEINSLLASVKQDAVSEVMKVIDIYYQSLTSEEIDVSRKKELQQEIEGML